MMPNPDFLKAADTMIERGWCQGRFVDDDARVCLVGALFQALPRRRYEKTLDIVIEMFNGEPAKWNDKPGRTEEEVVDALIAAAYWED